VAYYGHLKHPYQGKVYRRIERPAKEHIDTIAQTYTGFIIDRVGKLGALDPRIKPLDPASKVCGPAITVLGPELSLRRMAADIAQPGDVLVIAAGAVQEYACFGDGTARKMAIRGVQGVVIDGTVRDGRRIANLGFPCFCSGVNVRNYDYPVFPKLGAVNVPISCGDSIVYPGDLIFGDADGVICISRSFVPELCTDLLESLWTETEERLALRDDFRFGVDKELVDRGYEIVDESFSDDKR
jgi:4-hydroxy-4-methyl-2-oxoglutarate aldolase